MAGSPPHPLRGACVACWAAVVQETSRLVHCRDSPTNSVLAGAATGALLYKSHGEEEVATPAAARTSGMQCGGAAPLWMELLQPGRLLPAFPVALPTCLPATASHRGTPHIPTLTCLPSSLRLPVRQAGRAPRER